MLSDEPIDDDLEALLYAQVYYGKGHLTEIQNSEQVSVNKSLQECDIVEKSLLENDNYQNNPVRKAWATAEDIAIDHFKLDTQKKQNSTTEGLYTPNSNYNQLEESQNTPLIHDQDLGTGTQEFIEVTTSSNTNSPTKKSTQVITKVSLKNSPQFCKSQPQLLNNITINQYLYPQNFIQKLKSSTKNYTLSKKCRQDLSRVGRGVLSEQQFFLNLKRRLRAQKRQQEQIRKVYLKRQRDIAETEVICLSDSDNNNSDLEIIEESMNRKESANKTPRVKSLGKSDNGKNKSIDDDEIIYVAPPPVPVINVDSESESETLGIGEGAAVDKSQTIKQGEQCDELLITEKTSEEHVDQDETENDFLQPGNTSENFNFSLHGADFQNTEFVRPVNPTDTYETESSTSTSDFNRESSRQYCNTVKTIVFNEVDFPSHDIFEESNLEAFGEFITPKRTSVLNKSNSAEAPIDEPSQSKSTKRVNPRTSSESSSESEYESSASHKNLPHLSPMICDANSPVIPKNSNKTKKGRLEDETIDRSKKKNKEKLTDENDGVINKISAEEEHKQLKRKSFEEETPKKKSKKKKNKSGYKSAEENAEITSETPTAAKSILPVSQKKDLKDNWVVTIAIPKLVLDAEMQPTSGESSRKKKKKRKSIRTENYDTNLNDSLNSEEVQLDVTIEDQENEVTVEDNARKRTKKRKGREILKNTSGDVGLPIEETEKLNEEPYSEAEDENETNNDVDETEKKKTKRRKHKESSEKICNEEISACNAVETIEKMKSDRLIVVSEGTHLDSPHNLDEMSILDKNGAIEDIHNRKKNNKRKKRSSVDKKVSTDKGIISAANSKNEEKNDSLEQEAELEKSNLTDDKSNETLINNEEDVIIIEKAIPVHIIETSESESEDIITFEGVGNDMELANISAENRLDPIADHLDKSFEVNILQSKMSDNPEKWKILESDRYSLNIAKKGPRCNKCRQFGHMSLNCRNKPSVPACTLCGDNDHREPRCPNRVCFTCGKPGNFSTVYCYKCVKQRKVKCNLCNIVGHKSDYCPDLWRRYFLTTKEGPLTLPKNKSCLLKPRSKRWCSGCASSGHLEFECNSYKWIREYPASSPHIYNFNDVYQRLRKDESPRHLGRRRTPHEQSVSDETKQNTEPQSVEVSVQPTNSTREQGNLEYAEENLDSNITEKTTGSVASTVELESPPNTSNQTKISPIEQQQDKATNSSVAESEIMDNQRAVSSKRDVPVQSAANTAGHFSSRKSSLRREKINPLSVVHDSSSFTSYQSVFNPYSLLGAPVSLPPRGLFNPVPNNVLAQQLLSLANSIGYQNERNFNQNSFYQDNSSPYQALPFEIQIPSNTSPFFDNCRDISCPPLYYNSGNISYENTNYMNRSNRPHTVTRDQTEEGFDFGERGRQRFDYRRERGQRNIQTRITNPTSGCRYFDVDLNEGSEVVQQVKTNTNLEFIPLTTGTSPATKKNPDQIYLELAMIRRFLSGSPDYLKRFIDEEIEKLNHISKTDVTTYKKKLDRAKYFHNVKQKEHSNLKSSKKQITALYKQINMFIFGVHQLFEGSTNLSYLNNFLFNPPGRLNKIQRQALMSAYKYIFGGKHPNFDYKYHLNNLSVMYKN